MSLVKILDFENLREKIEILPLLLQFNQPPHQYWIAEKVIPS